MSPVEFLTNRAKLPLLELADRQAAPAVGRADDGGVRLALLPRCYQTIPNHADPCRTTSVPSVEILEPYIVVDLGGNACEITLIRQVCISR